MEFEEEKIENEELGEDGDFEKMEDWQAKAKEYLNGWKRAQADLINYKKDEAKRLETISLFANESLIADLLPVLDSFSLAMEAGDENINVIWSQLEGVLSKRGLEKINIEIGERFDPALHEAVMTVEGGGEAESDTIAEALEAGYRLCGRVIRPAKVKVIK